MTPSPGPASAWSTQGAFDMMAEGKAWQKTKAEAGWACLHWPTEYGGRGAKPIERVIWQQEEGVYATLSGAFGIGHGMCGPTMMAFASEKQKRRYLPPLAAGEKSGASCFPNRPGGPTWLGFAPAPNRRRTAPVTTWTINGQKIWTSGAQFSDYGLLITRTDLTVPKHKGLTMFFLNMKTPGIEVRPIKQANGQATFNEVYFTDVRVPGEQRLGPAGGGWRRSR